MQEHSLGMPCTLQHLRMHRRREFSCCNNCFKTIGPQEKKPNRQTTYIIGWLIKGMPF